MYRILLREVLLDMGKMKDGTKKFLTFDEETVNRQEDWIRRFTLFLQSVVFGGFAYIIGALLMIALDVFTGPSFIDLVLDQSRTDQAKDILGGRLPLIASAVLTILQMVFFRKVDSIASLKTLLKSREGFTIYLGFGILVLDTMTDWGAMIAYFSSPEDALDLWPSNMSPLVFIMAASWTVLCLFGEWLALSLLRRIPTSRS